MKIIIVGGGRVGYALAEQLSAENHDLVIIDKDASVLQKSQELLDVMVVAGNGASLETQKEVEVAHSDLLIAATSEDEVNLLCCILARRLGCKRTIARVRNPEYDQQIQFLRDDLGLSMFVNPEKMAAKEMFRLLQFPSFMQCDTFAKGKVEVVEMNVPQGNTLCGMTLESFSNRVSSDILICAVERNGEIIIPTGSFKLEAGDNITMSGATRDFGLLIKYLGLAQTKIKNVMIVGGSRTAVYLAKDLIHSHLSVKIIDDNLERCRELSEILPEAIVIHGDGTSQALLQEEGIQATDAVVTLTDIDEENLLISMYAKYMGVKKVITKIDRKEYSMVFKDKGLDSVVFPNIITSSEIVRYVRAVDNTSEGEILTMHKLADGKVEALEFKINSGVHNLNVPIMKLKIKKNILLCCINRKGTIIIPKGNDVIMEKDRVVLVTTADSPILKFNDIFLEDVYVNDKVGG